MLLSLLVCLLELLLQKQQSLLIMLLLFLLELSLSGPVIFD